VLGIVSEGDILAKERAEVPERSRLWAALHPGELDEIVVKLEARTAGEAMSSPVVTIRPGASLAEAAGLMIDSRVNRLPVVDWDGTLLGILTRSDLVRAFRRTDEEIRSEIVDEVALGMFWIPPETLRVDVRDGAVKLAGQVETSDTAELLAAFARRVAGVVTVDSELTWRVDGYAPEPRA
jgi:CBS domain-containing protein